MSTDRELLELAAKAAGVEIKWSRPYRATWDFVQVPDWNPLTDDADALRLAAALKINIDFEDQSAWKRRSDLSLVQEYWGGDYDSCYRRAIVRAAAALSQTTKGEEK